MKNYDTAYALAREMRESELYQSYLAAKEKAFEKQINRDLYKQFMQISNEIQEAQFTGKQISEQTQEKFKQLMGVLSLNAEVNAFILAEQRLRQTLNDIFKILTDTLDFSLEFLRDEDGKTPTE